MSNKSIDGLQRRTSTQGGRKVTANTTVKRRTVKRVSVDAPKTASNQATTRRKIGIPDTKKDLKALIAENEELERKSDVKNKKEGAFDKYINLLKAGGSNYPVELLKAAGCDLTTKEPFLKVVSRFNELLDKLEELLKD